MKIVLVNVWLDAERGGGTAERTRWLALHLARLGCKCNIVTMGPTPWLDDFTAAGIDVMQLRFVGQRFPIPLPPPLKILRLFRAADIIQVMGFWFLLGALCSGLARVVGKPLVLCPAGSLTKYGRSARLKRIYFQIAGRWMIRASDTVIATTEQERRLLISDFDVEPEKIFVSPNGIEAGEAGTRVAPVIPKARSILFVGRLTAIKAPDLLLEAFAAAAAAMPDVTLVIAGPDLGLRPQLELRTAELGLQSRVAFAGFVDEEKRSFLLGQTSLLVVPSHSEVMSMVALEAGAMGVPVLLTDQCGFDEVAKIGGGRVVPVDITALSNAMQQMISDDDALTASGQRLRAFVLEHYAWPNVAGHLLAHFRNLRPAS
ncbi:MULTISPECIES: glycosyltransferase [Bradyrhizobium]|uniref:Glycosyltransferase involved in cell wall bisynthesis n=2 Tax=Bradyrhizobium TaxID=374 RepID=A0ABY0Q8Z7_9BRAD|nr:MULTISPECIES: glycosyltransferase [Bradyrhizobium]SDJ71720.1 Glycosyltransferase involved in cell wall bisynthesis [Bradyrhizobium ottawaense]SEC21664.1 Glycosyltransferase involved in cell wall bisynthesis [Bradyrhizobium lablabi]